MLFDVLLVADTRNQVDLLPGEGLLGLLEHVGVADVEGIEDSIGVDAKHLLLCHTQLIKYY